jgi:hypothetical protein
VGALLIGLAAPTIIGLTVILLFFRGTIAAGLTAGEWLFVLTVALLMLTAAFGQLLLGVFLVVRSEGLTGHPFRSHSRQCPFCQHSVIELTASSCPECGGSLVAPGGEINRT